jgi:hypothetical protein
MRLRVFLGMFLTLVSTISQAEWVHIGSSAEERFYMTVDGVAHEGSVVKIWIMTDADKLITSGPTPYKSSKVLYWIDCTKRKSKIVSVNLFSGQNGGGKTLYSKEDEALLEWLSIPPASMLERIYKISCNKK